MEDRMTLIRKVRAASSTHDCPECNGPAYCAMEDGFSSNLCWCMSVEKCYLPETSHTECMCKRCLLGAGKDV